MTNLDFTYDAIPGRVVFGVGSRHRLDSEADQLGAMRLLVVASEYEEQIAVEVSSVLGERVVGRFSDVVQHVPVTKAREAIALTDELDVDTVVTIGGGSATGFGKAIARDRDVRQIAVPTTYAGSEMTPIWGMTDDGHKRTGVDLRVKPDVVVYDPELTLSLPARIAGSSGMNALAHAVEALYGPGANPVISAMALESIRALHHGLPRIVADEHDLRGRTDVLYGAYLAGVALATGGTALHHKTCHVLGGMFDLDHGDMNAVMLGHAVAYNAPAIPELIARMADALGADDVPGTLFDLAAELGAPTSLESIGMPADRLDETTERVVEAAAANVRPPEVSEIRQMLDDAFHGRRPA